MRCSIVRNCEAEASYYFRLKNIDDLFVEVDDGILVTPETGVLAFACLYHMEQCLDRGVSPEVFWSLEKAGPPSPGGEKAQ
jgi:hypothetical protein